MKITLFKSFIALCLLPLSQSIAAYEYADETTKLIFDINTENNTASVIGAGAISGEVRIPNSILGHRVTTIRSRAFEGRTAIEAVTVPNSVEVLGLGCFMNCTNLKKVVLGYNAQYEPYYYPGYGPYMGNRPFEGCTAIEELFIDSDLVNAGIPVRNLKKLTFGEHVTKICNLSDRGDGVREDMVNLEELTIGKNVKEIGSHSFIRSAKLGSISLPEGLESVGAYAFEKCSNVIFELPKTLVTIGYGAFMDCNALISVTIPGGVERIEDMTFAGCHGLQRLEMEEGVKEVGKYTFGECKSLNEIKLPETLNWIEASAFANCPKLMEITIPSSVGKIDEGAFANTSLSKVISLIKDPFEIVRHVFENQDESGIYHFTTATLYVPIGTIEKYKNTYAWNLFSVINEIESTTVVEDNAIVRKNTDNSIYDLKGQKNSRNYKGVVIFNGHKKIVH